MFAIKVARACTFVALAAVVFVVVAARSSEASETTGWAAYQSGNYPAAYSAFLERAQAGDANAQHNLAVMYDLGQGLPQDHAEAIKWYRLAARQGHAVSQNNLGILLENGRGANQNSAEAAKWYRKAAEQGQAISQHNLALLLEKGAGLPVDHKEAAHWFLRAAESGLADAQHNIAWMYSEGIGVPTDRTESAKWYLKAAEQGRAMSQNNLGNLYELGQGVEQDFALAMKWYRRAADQGLANAQYNVGWLYANAVGVPRDENEAALWYQLAAENGHADASTAIQALDARVEAALPRINVAAEKQSPVVSAARAAAAKLAPRPGPKPTVPSTLDAIDTFKTTRAVSPSAGAPRLVSLAARAIETDIPNNTHPPSDDAKYAVQVGAFRLAKNAGELVRRLAKIGHKPETVERVDGDGRVLYIVRVGRFEEKNNASRLVERLKKDGLSALVVAAN